jgi:hypothetical protein
MAMEVEPRQPAWLLLKLYGHGGCCGSISMAIKVTTMKDRGREMKGKVKVGRGKREIRMHKLKENTFYFKNEQKY